MTEELRDEVAAVLGEHDDPPGWMWSDSDQMVYACECGDHYVAGAIDVIQERDALAAAEWHRNHQAAALVPLLERREREVGARALREAADEADDIGGAYKLTSFDGEVTWFYPVLLVVGWLNNRADAITTEVTE